jgi:serine/threonine-protein kinase RsbW
MHLERGDDPAPRHRTAELCYHDVPADAHRLIALRHALSRWAAEAGMDIEQVEALTLASYEALANVVAHAYPDGDGAFDLLASAGAGRIEVTITDHGRWHAPSPDPLGLRGRGLPLIHTLTDDAEITRGPDGTVVRLAWLVPQVSVA